MIDIAGSAAPFSQIITDREVETIFRAVLQESNLVMSSFVMNSRLVSTTSGYGMAEETVKNPYFDGIIIQTEEISQPIKKLKL